MKVLVLGANGMLGHKLVQKLAGSFDVFAAVRSFRPEFEKTGICRPDKILPAFDATNFDETRSVIKGLKPDIVINAIGIIKHRGDSKNAVLSIETNSLLPHKLAEVTRDQGAKLITFSTDCVFRGDKGSYSETDPTDAEDMYGQSKALGEVSGEGCLTLRTSIIGRELSGSRSLLEWCMSNRKGEIKGFSRAIYTGFTTIAMSDIVKTLILDFPGLEGLYHVSSEPIDKYELLRIINREFGLGISIEKDEEFVIDRSLDSKKFKKATGIIPPDWESMIKEIACDDSAYDEWRKLRS